VIRLLLVMLAAQGPAIPESLLAVAEPEEVRIVAGGRAEARVVATVAEGFRIQANPASEPFLVPASLELEDDEHVRVGAPAYPRGRPYRLRGADEDLSIYEGTVVIRVPIEAARSGESAQGSVEILLEGQLRYQACNNLVCLRPSSVPVRLPVRIDPETTPAP
jgi:thiol:disulfide interchange protein DsbD